PGVTAAPGSSTAACRYCVAVSGIPITLSAASAFRLGPQALELLFEGDHLQLAAGDYFLEFLEIQDLLLELPLGLLQVANHLLVFAHVAQDADGADHPAARVAQRRGVEGRGDDLPAGAAGVQVRVAGDAALDDLAQGGRELACLLGTDEAGQRLLEQLVLAKADRKRDLEVGLEDLALEVGDEERVGGVLDEALGVGAGLVESPHVAQDADHADRPTVRIAQGGGVQAGGDDFATRTARVQDNVPHDTAFDHFAQCSRELPRFFGADEARQRLLEHLVLAKPEQLRNRVVGLQDFAFEVRDEDGVGGVGDDDVRIEGAVPLCAPIGALDRP